MDTQRSLTATYGQQEDKQLMEKTHTYINTHTDRKERINALLLAAFWTADLSATAHEYS